MRNQINYTFEFNHVDGSRISNVILKALRKNPILKVNTLKTPLHLRDSGEYIHKHNITFVNPSHENKLWTVKDEIIKMIPDLFPINYFFKFENVNNFVNTLGYKHEFSLYGIDSNCFKIYTKIKEQKSNSEPITAYKIEQ